MRILSAILFCSFLTACGSGDNTSTAQTTAANATPVALVGATLTEATKNSKVPANLGSRTLENPEIKVTIPRVPLEGALLIGQFTEQQYRALEGTVEGQSVVFRKDEPLRPGHYYAYFSDGTSVQLIADADQTMEISTTKEDPIVDARVTGNLDTELLYEALKFESGQRAEFSRISQAMSGLGSDQPAYEALRKERSALVDAREKFQDELFARAPGSLFASFKRAGRNPNFKDIRDANGRLDDVAQVQQFRAEFWESVDFSDERLLNTPVIFNKLKRFIKELTPQNATAIIEAADASIKPTLNYPEYFQFFANWITLQYEVGKTTVMDGAAIHVHMINNYFTRERAFWADSMTIYGLQQRASQMANSLVGQQGPNITVPGIDGQPKTLYDLKKPYIAVFMYNPECEHCIEETPQLVQAYQGMKDELDVYAIALDTEDAKWKAFVQNNGMQAFTNVYDPTNRSIFKTYFVDNTPELYLLGPDRKILSKNIKVNQLAEALRMAKAGK